MQQAGRQEERKRQEKAIKRRKLCPPDDPCLEKDYSSCADSSFYVSP